MISPVQLSYIFALLKHKNFQRAADACHVTQPTLSMQLKKAEEAIGFKIIDRDTNPISLTYSGQQLFPVLSSIQSAYDELEIKVQKLKGTYKAEIRIGDRKSTRLNSSHVRISYAASSLKKKST